MTPPGTRKADGAFRTIGEVAAETGVPQHVLRYWETRFPQLKPVTRAGNRRHYRPDDIALVRRIDDLLHRQGYTLRGVRLLLDAGHADGEPGPVTPAPGGGGDALPRIRAALIEALARDDEGGSTGGRG